MNKYFMLGLAGLAFAACSNEEDAISNSTFEGNGVVAVRIVTPALTKAAGSATGGANNSTVSLTGDVTVTLTGTGADGAYNESITINANDLNKEGTTVLRFWNVKVPQKLTAKINGGVDDYSSVDLTGLQKAAAEIPAYGETSAFNKTTQSGTPSFDQDNSLADTEAGADAGDKDKVYQLYTATVTMAIPVARLEVGGIYHEDDGDGCIFESLTLDGAYLDSYCAAGSKYDAATGKFPNSTVAGLDYSFDGTHGTGAQSALRDVISPAVNFLETTQSNAVGAYTYNFYANGTNPIFKLYFAKATGNAQNPVNEPRYAMITNYYTWNDTNEDGIIDEDEKTKTVFENGKIYRILDAELADENIIGDEGGNTLFGVDVTVVEATWSIVDIHADWAE